MVLRDWNVFRVTYLLSPLDSPHKGLMILGCNVLFVISINKPCNKQLGYLRRHRNVYIFPETLKIDISYIDTSRATFPSHLIMKSTLVQVMAWCLQAASHFPSQCWPMYVAIGYSFCNYNLGPFIFPLTHLPLVPHICVSESGQHWFR